MIDIKPKYITDRNGKKISAILPIKEFKSIMEELEELDDIRLYDASKKDNEGSISAVEAFKKIEAKKAK